MSFVIRSEQIEVFTTEAEKDFARQLVSYLLENHDDTTVRLPCRVAFIDEIPRGILLEMVERGIMRARRYGMTWESSWAAFVSIMFVVAPNFDEHPLIRRVLNDENSSPDLRVDLLFERTEEENWDEAEAQYDPKAWGVNPEPPEKER